MNWLTQHHPGVKPPFVWGRGGQPLGRHRLQWYELFLGLPQRPPDYRGQQTAPRISRVRDALGRDIRDRVPLSRRMKRAWSLVLGRNARDCTGMRYVDERVWVTPNASDSAAPTDDN